MNEDLTRQLLRRIAALERRLGIVETSEAGAAHSHAYSDHGNLTGLTDDDHTQYLLAAGTRALTADWDIGDGRKLIADVVRARDAAGLSLQDDGGNTALKVNDGGRTTVRNIQSLSFTLADDALVNLVATYGIPATCMVLYTITNTVAGFSSIVGCRAATSGYCEVVGTANVATLTVGTTELTDNAGATPGTDGDVNISADSGGKIIIKNRLGGNRTFNILVVG